MRHTAPRPRAVMATVVATTRLNDHMTRITLASPEFDRIDQPGPDHLVRLFLPPSPDAELCLPSSEQWWPEVKQMPAERRPVVRNYTVRSIDRAASRLDVDFVLHGDAGPASAWAYRAASGDRIGVLSDGARYAPPADTDWRLLVGDETALPAIAAILDGLDAGERALVVLEVAGAGSEIPLRSTERAPVTWLHRSPGRPRGSAVLAHLRDTELPGGTPYAWIAGESALATSVRRHLVNERGFAKPQVYFCGYWREGPHAE